MKKKRYLNAEIALILEAEAKTNRSIKELYREHSRLLDVPTGKTETRPK